MEISTLKINSWAKMGQTILLSGVALPDAKKDHDNLLVVTADMAYSVGLSRFLRMYPNSLINVGIAEQNLISISAAMALEGYKVYASTYASFITFRGLEQIRQNLAYLQTDVKLIGNYSGYTMGTLSVSHWATEDIAIMRALPNMVILSAADCLEAYKITKAAAMTNQPTYIRLYGERDCPIVYTEDFNYEIGKGIVLRTGEDVAIVATGSMVHESLQAADILKEKGIGCTVIDMHTIKPLDTELLDRIFEEYPLVVTVEEHNVIGGLGSAISEYCSQKTARARQLAIGIPDRFAVPGSRRYLWEQSGLTAPMIAERIIKQMK